MFSYRLQRSTPCAHNWCCACDDGVKQSNRFHDDRLRGRKATRMVGYSDCFLTRLKWLFAWFFQRITYTKLWLYHPFARTSWRFLQTFRLNQFHQFYRNDYSMFRRHLLSTVTRQVVQLWQGKSCPFPVRLLLCLFALVGWTLIDSVYLGQLGKVDGERWWP